MKALALVVTAFLAVTLHAGPGHAQSHMTCANNYAGCMDRCATMGQSPTQGRCFMTCQKVNDACGAKLYGSWRAPFNANAGEGGEAMAHQPTRQAPQRNASQNQAAQQLEPQQLEPQVQVPLAHEPQAQANEPEAR